MLNGFRFISLFLALVACMPAQALEAEALEVVTLQLQESWASSCVTIPLGNHQHAAETSEQPDAEPAALSFDQALDLAAWGETDAVTVTFFDRLGESTPEPSAGGGTLLVELTGTDDPLIEIAPDASSACFLLQQRHADIRPTSIIPATLDDGRPGRVYFFDYTANWSPTIAQRFGMAPERIAAALVSFNPGTGWDRIESLLTEEAGGSFAPDSFSDVGLALFDVDHPDGIAILSVPTAYPSDPALTVRYGTVLPTDVVACRTVDPWEVPNCLDVVARSGTILGALSLCGRDDTACLTDVLHARAPATVADWCLHQQGIGGSGLSRCQAFAALTDTHADPATALPDWRSAKLIRRDEAGGLVAFFIRAHSLEYEVLDVFEISNRNRLAGTPYLKLSCAAGRLGAAMLYPALLPLWAPGEQVSASVNGRWNEKLAFPLVANGDGTTLTFDAGDIERFVGNAFGSESFDLITSGESPLRAHFSTRALISAFGGDIDLPTLLADAGCDTAIEEAGL